MNSCKLCYNKTPLCDTHIIPESFYKHIKNLNNGNIPVMSDNPNFKNKIIQKGFSEHLLCAKCDNKLGEYDDYAFRFCKRYWGQTIKKSKLILIKNVDYCKLRLFQLSLLWRAIISTRKEFVNIQVDPVHALNLRNLIFNKSPGKFYEYSCIMRILIDGNQVIDYAFETPIMSKINNIVAVKFVFGGFRWIFMINNNLTNFEMKNLFIKPNNSLWVIAENYFEVVGNIKYFDKLISQGKIKFASDYLANRKK